MLSAQRKTWLAAVALFVAGLGVGFFGAQTLALKDMNAVLAEAEPMPTNLVVELMAGRLELTPEQAERLRPEVTAMMAEVMALRGAILPAEEAIYERYAQRIDALLEPEQQARHAAMRQEFSTRRARCCEIGQDHRQTNCITNCQPVRNQ